MRPHYLLFAALSLLSAASVAYLRCPVPWSVAALGQLSCALLLVLLAATDRKRP